MTTFFEANVFELQKTVYRHVQQTRHTLLVLSDSPGTQEVGIECMDCAHHWLARHPGDLVIQSPFPVLVELYRSLDRRREFLALEVAHALASLNESGSRRSVWDWIQEED